MKINSNNICIGCCRECSCQKIERERKYLILKPDLDLIRKLANEELDIVQTYLTSNDLDVEVRVRKQITREEVIYTKTIKKTTKNAMERVEEEIVISEQKYFELLKTALPNPNSVEKKRFKISHGSNNHPLEIDIYPTSNSYAILEIELEPNEDDLSIPDYLSIVKEVTEDKDFSNRKIALNNNRLPV